MKSILWKLNRVVLGVKYFTRERWEYETFNSDNMRDWQTFGAAGWEVIAVGWGKSNTNVLAKRKLRWFR